MCSAIVASCSRLLASTLPSLRARAGSWLPFSNARGLVSVVEARNRIFGNALPDGEHGRFKSLNRLKRVGLMGPKWVDYYPEQSPLAKHPIVRKALNEERVRKLELRQKLGKGPPKKGMGSAAKKKKR